MNDISQTPETFDRLSHEISHILSSDQFLLIAGNQDGQHHLMIYDFQNIMIRDETYRPFSSLLFFDGFKFFGT
jgi:hypothetical protein